MTLDQESLSGRAKIEVDRQMIAWRLPDIFTLAAIVSFLMLSFLPREAAAHGSDHPTELRNARNQFTHLKPQRPAPMMPILAEDGSLLDLGRFRGKLVLLNIWATWCPPCIDELPALDRLQALLGNDLFALVALSIDEGDIDIPVSFVRRLGLRSLSVTKILPDARRMHSPFMDFRSPISSPRMDSWSAISLERQNGKRRKP